MALAARLPAPIAEITVAAPVATSPPAYTPFLDVLKVKEGKIKARREQMEGIIEKYLREIRDLWKTVDQLEIKEG